MMLTDAHTHPCDEGFGSGYRDLDVLDTMIGCCSRTEDWDGMGSCADPRVVRSYGVHPWYADEWDDSVKKRLVDILSSDKDACVGEIGLDTKRGDIVVQERVFREQLSVASSMGRLVSIHMVGPCEDKVLDAIRGSGYTGPGIVLHSYAGQDSYIRSFCRNGCYISVSPRLVGSSPRKASRIIPLIPMDRLLLETDHPYVGKGFTSMEGHVRAVSDILGMDPDTLSSLVTDNIRRLIGHG